MSHKHFVCGNVICDSIQHNVGDEEHSVGDCIQIYFCHCRFISHSACFHRQILMRPDFIPLQMLQPKLPVNINNQYPMSRSPPLFDSSSPGPDPYHSLQSLHNVYEELHPAHDSDVDSEFRGHSDDDFAEDELSLAGETTAVLMATSTSTSASTPNHPEAGQTTALIPAIYNESNLNYRRMGGDSTAGAAVASNIGRDSVLSLSSTTNERNGAGDSSTSSRSSSGATRIPRNALEASVNGPFGRGHCKTLNNHRDINNTPDRTGLGHNFNQYHDHVNNGNGSGSSSNKRMNSNRLNNNTMANTMHHHNHHHHQHPQQHQPTAHGQTLANNNMRSSKSRDNICGGGGASCVECRVERQNAVNRQLSSTMHNKKRHGHGQIDQHHGAISTIFHGRAMNGNNGHFGYPPEHHWTNGNQRMRTMPYATATIGSAVANHDPAYDYAQPVFHDGMLYDTGFTADVGRLQQPMDRNLDCPYTAAEYTSLGSSASGMSAAGNLPHNIYSRDSSFGSDSGYSRGESGGSASGNVLGLGLGRLKKSSNGGSKSMGKSVL